MNGLRIGTQNVNNTLYPVTKDCQTSMGTIVCRVQIDGAVRYLEAQSRLSCPAKKNILVAMTVFLKSSIWIWATARQNLMDIQVNPPSIFLTSLTSNSVIPKPKVSSFFRVTGKPSGMMR